MQSPKEEKKISDCNVNVFIGGLSLEATLDEVKEFLGQFGKVKSCRLNTDSKGKSKGFGFAEFYDKESAEKSWGYHMLHGVEFEVKKQRDREEDKKEQEEIMKRKIFIKKLPENPDEESLLQFFSKYGEIEHVRFLKNKKNLKSRKAAFIIFKDQSSVQKVLSSPQATLFKSQKIEIKAAKSKVQLRMEKKNEKEDTKQKDKKNSEESQSHQSHLEFSVQTLESPPSEQKVGKSDSEGVIIANPQEYEEFIKWKKNIRHRNDHSRNDHHMIPGNPYIPQYRPPPPGYYPYRKYQTMHPHNSYYSPHLPPPSPSPNNFNPMDFHTRFKNVQGRNNQSSHYNWNKVTPNPNHPPKFQNHPFPPPRENKNNNINPKTFNLFDTQAKSIKRRSSDKFD